MSFPLGARLLKQTPETFTFSNAANLGAIGTVPAFTVTGQILLVFASLRCSVTFTGTSATIALGSANNTGGIIAATTATGIIAGYYWQDTSPEREISPAITNLNIGANLIFTIATANITAGVLDVNLYWHPLSAGANLS